MKTIKQLREDKGWTREEMAAVFGLSVATIYKWEAGTAEPRAATLRRMAREFGVSMDDIDFVEVESNQGRRQKVS